MDGGQGDSIVLEEEIDPNYEPTEDEVIEYAKWLGMDLDAERDLFWIAREGLKAPLPENWKPCKTTDTGEIYYFNFASGASTWDHPCDEYYRKLYDDHKKKTIQGKKFQDTDDKKKKEKDDIAEILGKKSKKAPKKAPKGDSLGAVKSGMEKKPLGAIGKMPLPGGLGALKPVGALGRPTSMKSHEAKSDDDDDDDDEGKSSAPTIKALPSRKPLGKKDTPKNTSDDEAVESKTEELAAKLRKLEDEHASQVAALQAKLAAKESEIKQQQAELDDEAATIEKKLQKLHKEHADEVENVKELDKKLTKRRKDLETEHREYMDNAEAKFNEKKRDLARKQEKELKDMDEKHKEALEDMDAAHEKALQRHEAIRRKEEMQAEHREKEEASRLDKLNAELDIVKTEAAQYKRQVKTLEEKMEEASKAPTYSPDHVAALEASTEELKRQVEKLKEQLKQKDADMEAQMKRQENDAFDEARRQDPVAATSQTNASTNKQVEALEEEVTSLKKMLQDAKQCAENADKNEKSWEADRAKMAAELATWKTKHDEIAGKLKATETAHVSEVAQLQRKLGEAAQPTRATKQTDDSGTNEWQEKFEALAVKHDVLQTECAAAKSTIDDLKTDATKLDMAFRDLTTKYDAACKENEANGATTASMADSKRALEATIESLSAAKVSLLAQLEDAKASHRAAMERAAQELRQAKADTASWQSQYENLMDATNKDQAINDQLQQWQAKYNDLQSSHEESEAASRAQLDAVDRKLKGLERDHAASVETWKKKLHEAESDGQRQLAVAKATIADLQAKWTSMQSQESSTSTLVASLQEQLNQAYRQAQESHDSNDAMDRAHKRALEAHQAQWKQQLDDLQVAHSSALQNLKSDLIAVESAKRKLDDQRATLERKLKQKENEVAMLTTQIQAQQATTQETATSMWEWEKDKLMSQRNALESEKADVEARLDTLRAEHDVLLDTHHRTVLDKEVADKKAKQSDLDKDQLAQKLKGVEKECDAVQTKWRALTTEANDLKTALSKAKLGLQTAEAQYEKASEECRSLEGLVKQARDLSDKHQADARGLQLQLDDALFQKQRVEHDLLNLQHELDRVNEQNTLRLSSTSAMTSSGEHESLRHQVEQLTADSRAANDKVRQLQARAQEFETKYKQGQETYDRHTTLWVAEKQSLVDKLDKLKSQHQQLDRQLRTTSHDKEDVEAQRDRLHDEKADLEKRLKHQTDAVAAAQTKLSETVHHVDELDGKFRSATYELHAAEGKLKRLEHELDRTKAELASRTQDKDSMEAKWRQDVAQFEAKLKSIRQDQTDQLHKRVGEEQAKRDEAALEWKRDADDKKKEWQARLSQLESDKSAAQAQLIQVSKELATTQNDMEHLSSLKQKLEAQAKSHAEQAEKDRNEWQDQLDQVKAKLKTALAEKDELMVSVASAGPNRGNRISSMQQDIPPQCDNGPAQLKLQMAQVSKTELETHLHDITMQCESWRRKAALLDSRSRDLALEIEALHVENAALRASSQRMHTSALDSLSTVERLNYEHKKRMVRSEYMTQLREFTEREELALARQKARVRASCERQLDELVGDFEKQKAQRMDQEEREFQSALHHCQSENQMKLGQVLKDHRDKLAALEHELQHKQTKHLQTLSKQMQEEEDQLSARLRDTKQLNREDDLAHVSRLQPGSFEVPVAWTKLHDEPARVAAAMSPSRSPARQPVKVRKPESKPHHHAWRRRLQQEHELLSKTKQYLTKQKRSLKQRMAKLQDEKEWWQRRPHYHTKARDNMKYLLEQHAHQLASDAKELKATEKWMVKRERKIHALDRSCNQDVEVDLDEDGEGDPSEASVDVHVEQLLDDLVSDGSTMSAKLHTYSRSQMQAAATLPWPSEIAERYEAPSQPSYSVVYPSRSVDAYVDRGGHWAGYAYQPHYTRLPERVHAYEPFMPTAPRTPLYDSKLSNWVHKRERASAAASAHSNYLTQLSQELKAYSSKYQTAHSEGEVDALP
ncbi:hypothetical protein H310_06224 [Aphanomyces invadans]|uniref:WW domain-containing protein n=1 Tax=Aphanomyces invadans TaxID=157072 RepID=A0A024U7J7_9STRA|nr:hypothetical protein H310_06224 [Aphanomyces invadans]ETW01578.1 hypothetical protein H310_06224 [Aphanomyces invadans]|eukprot:XP_008869426.1 hypothetical protein H310_06224 [Aphanomyces invadans]